MKEQRREILRLSGIRGGGATQRYANLDMGHCLAAARPLKKETVTIGTGILELKPQSDTEQKTLSTMERRSCVE